MLEHLHERRVLFTAPAFEATIDPWRRPRMRAQVKARIVADCVTDTSEEVDTYVGIVLTCTPIAFLEEPLPRHNTSMNSFTIKQVYCLDYDLVLWWRTIQFLSVVEVIQEIWIIDLFCACQRPHLLRTVAPLRDAIERVRARLRTGQSYEEVMSRPVPREIVATSLLLLAEGKDVKDSTLSLEVGAGTLRWSQELRAAGVKHPDYYQAQLQVLEDIADRYDDHFASFAVFNGYEHRRHDFSPITWGLYRAIECGIEKTYGLDTTFLFTVLEGDGAWYSSVRSYNEQHAHDPTFASFPVRLPEECEVRWMAWYHAFRPQEDQTADEALLATLRDLLARWKTFPVAPLVS